jgi:hypothetical protein
LLHEERLWVVDVNKLPATVEVVAKVDDWNENTDFIINMFFTSLDF